MLGGKATIFHNRRLLHGQIGGIMSQSLTEGKCFVELTDTLDHRTSVWRIQNGKNAACPHYERCCPITARARWSIWKGDYVHKME